MTVKFNCLVKAESLPDAWGKLEEVCAGLYYRERSFDDDFTATVIDAPEDDERHMTVLELIKMLKDESWKTQDVLSAEVYVTDCEGDWQTPKVKTRCHLRDGKPHKALIICGEED